MDNKHYDFTLIPADAPLDNLFNEWAQLTQKIPDGGFIHQPQWFISHLEAYPGNKRHIWFITQRNNRTLTAVYPLQYVQKKQFGLNLKTWQIFWPGHMGINDFIYPKDDPHNAGISHLINFLNQQRHLPWHMLLLQKVPENASIAYSLEQFSLPLHIGVYHHDSKYIACKPNFEETVSAISSKFKRNNRRKLRKLEKSGSVYYKMAKTESELNTAFEQFLEIEAANWKGRNKSALKYDQKQRNFYRELLRLFGKKGQCRIHTLWLNDQPIASQFALVINDTFHLLKIGYNANYHDVSPGGILLNETIRRFSGDEQIKKISFVTGSKWNDDWSPQIIRVYNHFIYNKNMRSYIAFCAEKIKSILRQIKHQDFTNGNEYKK